MEHKKKARKLPQSYCVIKCCAAINEIVYNAVSAESFFKNNNEQFSTTKNKEQAVVFIFYCTL